MKSILMIGMGKFGHLLCMNMAELDNEIMIVDEKEEMLEDLLPIVTSAKKSGIAPMKKYYEALVSGISTFALSVSEPTSKAVWRLPA